MGYLENLERDRRTKLDRVRSLGMNPYGQLSGWDHVLSIEQARDFHIGVKGVREATIPERDAWVFAGREEQLKDCVLRGRVTAKNNRGKLKFFFIQDMTGEIQVMLSKDKFTEPGWEFVSQIDVFDHIEVRGSVIETQTGEITIAATDFVFQGKSISPPPEKYHGVKDEEILVRQRYLALIQDKPLRDRLVLRSSVTRSIRMSLEHHDYIEVETPVLSMHANGASARPFTTHHNALDQDFHLRIAPELDLKRLLVGGLERVYEIGRVFRNEGVDATHNPEFTILECYEAYADASRMMVLCEDIIKRCTTEVAKTLGNIDAMLLEPLLTPFRRVTMEKMFSLVGVDLFDEAAVMQAGADRKIHAADYAGMVDKMADHLLPSCNGGSPLFLTGYPAAMCPLARRKDDRTADRFELFVFTPSGPMEVANGYSELNDPDEQLKNFEEQAHHKMIEDLQQEELEGGLGELSEPLLDSVSDHYKNTLLQRHIDHDYVNALKIGLPMAGGLGIGVDRLMMVLTGSETIRDVIAFPLVKRKAE